MKTKSGIKDYENLSYNIQRYLDQKAYSKYYSDYFENDKLLTFNSWYGTNIHEKYINLILRKYKLKKIKKDNQ